MGMSIKEWIDLGFEFTGKITKYGNYYGPSQKLDSFSISGWKHLNHQYYCSGWYIIYQPSTQQILKVGHTTNFNQRMSQYNYTPSWKPESLTKEWKRKYRFSNGSQNTTRTLCQVLKEGENVEVYFLSYNKFKNSSKFNFFGKVVENDPNDWGSSDELKEYLIWFEKQFQNIAYTQNGEKLVLW